MKYKYYLIALIIILFLICLLYVPNDECNNGGDGEYDEGFSSENKLSTENLDLFAESFVDNIVRSTYVNVITPCTKTTTNENTDVDGLIKCISSYDRYYESIIKEPTFELYDNLKRLEDATNYNYSAILTDTITSREQHRFVMTVASAYSRSLADTLKYIKLNQDKLKNIKQQDNDKPMTDQELFAFTFVPIFTHFSKTRMIRALKQVYRDRRPPGSEEQVSASTVEETTIGPVNSSTDVANAMEEVVHSTMADSLPSTSEHSSSLVQRPDMLVGSSDEQVNKNTLEDILHSNMIDSNRPVLSEGPGGDDSSAGVPVSIIGGEERPRPPLAPLPTQRPVLGEGSGGDDGSARVSIPIIGGEERPRPPLTPQPNQPQRPAHRPQRSPSRSPQRSHRPQSPQRPQSPSQRPSSRPQQRPPQRSPSRSTQRPPQRSPPRSPSAQPVRTQSPSGSSSNRKTSRM